MNRSCQICKSEMYFFSETDFNRSCADVFEQARIFLTSDQSVQYYRCCQCGFINTEFFQDWNFQDFAERVYNADYGRIDVPFQIDRPHKIAKFLSQIFSVSDSLNFLDFGGGNGKTADFMRSYGFEKFDCYDPIYTSSLLPVLGSYDVITCFEVFEHVFDQAQLLKNIQEYCHRDSVVLFSTLLQPVNISQVCGDWWYIGPRNGHMSFHTEKSLSHLLSEGGMELFSFNQELHLAWFTEVARPESLLMRIGNGFVVNDQPPSQHRNWS